MVLRPRSIVLCLLCLAVSSCGSDDTAVPDPTVKFDELRILSVVPAMEEAGQFVPVCRSTEDVSALQFNVLLLGSVKALDNDLSIKPGDEVDKRPVLPEQVTPELFQWSVDCVEGYPDGDLASCSGLAPDEDATALGDVSFFSYNQPEPTNQEPVGVAVLFDMSGSMQGLVDPTMHAERAAAAPVIASGPLDRLATDPKDARYEALLSFIKSLNANDPLILFAYNEEGIEVVCELPAMGEETREKLEVCFSADRSLLFSVPPDSNKSAIDRLKGNEWGRTPLWSAVELAYQYMSGVTDESKRAKVTDYALRHILVIGDGPDTCSASPELDQCEGECGTYNTDYETVRKMVEAVPAADRVPVHFVQIAAPGYQERDPRQQELACLTGGQYRFINAQDIPSQNFEEVLRDALLTVRYAFRGYWRFSLSFQGPSLGEALARGWLYGITAGGKILIGDQAVLVMHDTVFFAGVSHDTGVDERVSFRMACDPEGEASCPESGPHNACSNEVWWCDEETLTCRSALSWLNVGEPSSCVSEDAYIALETREIVDGETVVTRKLYNVGPVETRCCEGRCMPPAPPAIPEEVAEPPLGASRCFWYDETMGWRRTNPALFDPAIAECVSSSDCLEPGFCRANVCVRTCVFESDCTETLGDAYQCSQSTCSLTCSTDEDCPGAKACQGSVCRHRECNQSSDCPSGQFCNDWVCELDFDQEADQAWVYEATLNIRQDCPLTNFEPYFASYAETEFQSDDWAYCVDAQNCYEPPN